MLIALLAFNWLHPFATGPTVETAYLLPQGHKGEDGYFDPYKMQYSADRMTQTVVTYSTYGGSVPHVKRIALSCRRSLGSVTVMTSTMPWVQTTARYGVG